MPMPFMSKPSPPPYQKPASLFERLGITRPAPKSETKPPAAPPTKAPGLFGKEGYKSYSQLRESARGAPFAPLPGTSQPIGKEKRVGFIKELEEYGKRSGQLHGLSESAFRERVLPQIKRDLSAIYRKTGSTESKEYKELDRKRQLWEKGFPK